ncbi:hypothetical protein Tco_1548321 [Tanacetum coccineum]
MAGLDFCSKHNMVAYLEKNDGNTEFHQIMDFLTHSSIHFALTVSPIVLTSFVKHFWTTAKSRTVNNISYIDAIVAGKPVTMLEASIRSDLLFDDTDGIDTLNNQAIFDTIQLMGPSESQPIPSPTHPSADQPESQPDPSPKPSSPNPLPNSNPEGSSGNHGGQSSTDRSLSGNEDGLAFQSVYDLCISLCTQVTAQATEIKDLKAQIKQLKRKARPVINHHKAWFRAAMLKKQQNKKDMEKPKKRRSISKQGRKAVKSSKGAPSVQTNTDGDALDTDLDETINEAMDYTFAQDEGKTDSKVEEPKTSSKTKEFHMSCDTLVVEDKGSAENGGSTKGTDLQQSTVKPDEGTAEIKDQVSGESNTSTVPTMTSTPTPIVFGDDETIAQVLVTMSQNKINPKAKGKGMIEEEDESDTESKDITEAEKKFNMLANDEEMARKVQEEWEAEEEKKRLAEEEATKVAFINEYDIIQARLNANKILTEKLQEEEREKFTIEERAKLLHDTIAAQRRFLAQQRSEVIRNILPSRTQLRNQMMTYLKHVRGKKHSDLKTKFFEEIQVLYEKVKMSDENFIAIGSVKDVRVIKDLNKKVAGIKKADSIKKESKEVGGTKKRKLGTRKKMKSMKRRFRQDTSEDDETNSEKENDALRLCLTIAPDEDKGVDYEIIDKKYPIIEWKSEHLGIKPQYDETKDLEEINLNVVIRSNGQRRYFSTLMRVLSIFDRDDLSVVYQLMMDRYKDEIPEGFDRVLWGDLMIMFNPSDEDEFWNSQKKVLVQMLELKLESEEDNTMALELIRFVKKLIDQTVPGKDKSNLLIADSLLKTIWLSIHLVVYNEELAIPEQTATGKGTSNPLMAGGLPKTTKPT